MSTKIRAFISYDEMREALPYLPTHLELHKTFSKYLRKELILKPAYIPTPTQKTNLSQDLGFSTIQNFSDTKNFSEIRAEILEKSKNIPFHLKTPEEKEAEFTHYFTNVSNISEWPEEILTYCKEVKKVDPETGMPT